MASMMLEQTDKKNNSQQQSVQTTLTDFKVLHKLGEGAYSSVYKVLRLADMKEYALKKVKLLNLSEKERENALNEVRILASVKQKNVISYKEAFWDNEAQCLWQVSPPSEMLFMIKPQQKSPYEENGVTQFSLFIEKSGSIVHAQQNIVMEYADNGDLFQKICEHQKKGTEFLENEIWKVLIQIVRALKSLHELRIMHRDLKSANVFLYKDWTAKLGDMNVSKLSNYKGLNYTQTGTPYYASPEVWRDEPYDSKSDIWSLGCVLYEMVTLKPPFRADDMQGLYKRVLKGVYQKIPGHFSTDLSNIVQMLLQTKPSLRPSCEQLLEHPILKRRSEKFFPEEHPASDKATLYQEIKVPKNFMYLTDKLPAANYDEYGGKFYKNRSEVKLKLPKLTGSMVISNGAGTQSQSSLEYQLPQINHKQSIQGQPMSIYDQVESMNVPSQQNQNMGQKNRNIQQQQIIIQVKPKEKKNNPLKVSSLHQLGEGAHQGEKLQPAILASSSINAVIVNNAGELGVKDRSSKSRNVHITDLPATTSGQQDKQLSIGVTNSDVLAVNESIANQNIHQTPSKQRVKGLSINNEQDPKGQNINEDSQGKKSHKVGARKSKQSSRANSERARHVLSDDGEERTGARNGADSILAQGRNLADERTSTISQRDLDLSENKDVMPDDLPPPITSKSPQIKQLSNKIQQIQKSNTIQLGLIKETSKQQYSQLPNSRLGPSAVSNSILQDDDSPQRQQGYRYASLQPQKRDNDVDITPKLPMIRKLPLAAQQQLPQISSSAMGHADSKNNGSNANVLLYEQAQTNIRSLSPYRNPSLIQPISSKQELYKLKHSINTNGILATGSIENGKVIINQSHQLQNNSVLLPSNSNSGLSIIKQNASNGGGKLPKIKASEQLLKQMSKNGQQYYLKGSAKMQNMYYRVANSYMKGHPQQMNIVGNQMKSYQQIYGASQINQLAYSRSPESHSNYHHVEGGVNSQNLSSILLNQNSNGSGIQQSSYFQPTSQSIIKNSKLMQQQQQQINSPTNIVKPSQNLSEVQHIKAIEQTKQAGQAYLQTIIETANQNNHGLLARPSKKMQKPTLNSESLVNSSSMKALNSQFQGLDGFNNMIPKNQSQVLLKYQIQETKQ